MRTRSNSNAAARSEFTLTRELKPGGGSLPPDETRLALLLAAEADCDPRTARRALQGFLHGRVGERIARAAVRLGITLPTLRP